MMETIAKNPFIIGHPASGEHLADREREVEAIAKSFTDASSRLVVYGDRRLGKTSAIRRAAEDARKTGTPVIVVDLAKVTSIEGASQAILSALQKEVGRRWKDTATSLVTRFTKSQVTLGAQPDPSGGLPTFTFSIAAGPDAKTRPGSLLVETLDAIEAEMAARHQSIGIALDEFQRIAKWEPEIDWLLKGVFDEHRHVSYVLAGSQRSIIDAMLEHKTKSGLYKMVDLLVIPPLPVAVFAAWITRQAAATAVVFGEDVARALIAVAGPRTRDVVQLARALWDMTQQAGAATIPDVAVAMDDLVTEQGAHHLATWERFKTDTHRRILIVVAHNPKAELSSTATLKRFSLGAKSSANRILKTMIADEHIIMQDGKRRVDDPFFKRWIELHAFREFNLPVPQVISRTTSAP